MMNFFKKLFKKKEETIKIGELDRWFDANLKPELGQIKDNLQQVEQTKKELGENIKALEKVEVKDQVQKKIKDVVEGNVPAYTRAVEIFLEKINVPEEINSQTLASFYETTQSELDQFGKRTARNFAIMQTLIGQELAATAKNLKKIDELSKNIMKEAKKLEKTEKTKKKIEELKEAKRKEKENRELIKNYENEKENLTKEEGETESKIKELEKSNAAKELKELKQELINHEASKNELDSAILSLFSPLQKAFKRYNNQFFIKKVDEYINDAAGTLKQDNELEIKKYLEDIKKMIEEGKIDLKEDKKKKALESIEMLSEEYMEAFLKESKNIEEETKSVEEKIKNNTYEQEKEELKNKLKEKETRKTEIDKEMSKIKGINIKNQKEEIEKDLSNMGYEVRIDDMD
ncbi:MAG: hypothetical protein V1645_03620 [archaeon]